VAAALGPALFALITTLRSEQAALMVTLCLLLAGAVLVLLHVAREKHPLQRALGVDVS
jgi:MFS-type transporter involved in bile tolerance (Atg22 family)